MSKETGIGERFGKAWGAVATDINNDGRMDLFVLNDTVANLLYVNRGGRFEETGLAADVAYSADGRARSGMGVDSEDFDQDGWMDLFAANIDEGFFRCIGIAVTGRLKMLRCSRASGWRRGG